MTFTLRQQHEAAALAAGLSIRWVERACKGGHVGAAFIGDVPWRPRDDDGDSQRLACALRMGIIHAEVVNGPKQVQVSAGHNTIRMSESFSNESDRASALRSAIFRAAASEGQRIAAVNTAARLGYGFGSSDLTSRLDPDEDLDDEPECEHCRGDGMDPDCDYLLPCPMCQGEQTP